MPGFNALQHLNSIRAFDAVLRLGSVQAAAADLNVTDGAVSRHIKQLESLVGMPLFRREFRKLTPTDLGLRMGRDIRAGLERIAQINTKVQNANDIAQLVIAAPATFLSRWLIPRQTSLQKAIGGRPLMFTTYHGPPAMSPSEIHVFIGVGPVTQLSHIKYTPFMTQTLCLVVETETYKRVSKNPNWTRQLTRFTPASFPNLWTVWSDRFIDGFKKERLKYDGPEIVLERMHYAIDAVESGQGYTVAPKEYVQDALKAGRLRSVLEGKIHQDFFGFHVPQQFTNQSAVERTVMWLQSEGHQK